MNFIAFIWTLVALCGFMGNMPEVIVIGVVMMVLFVCGGIYQGRTNGSQRDKKSNRTSRRY